MSSSNLPPSTEEAYRKKCIELRRRMQEVEENNDATRLRRARLVRGIRKMRIERAILLDSLAKRMRRNGAGGAVFDEDSEDSTEGPPTPQERPLRIKKPHRRLPDMMSSPVLAPALPSTTTQAPLSNLPTPAGVPGVQNDPFATTSKYQPQELMPPPESATSSLPTYSPPLPVAQTLFLDHFVTSVLPRYPQDLKDHQQSDAVAIETWNTLPDHIRSAWTGVEHAIKANYERSKAAEEWKKTVGNRSRSTGAKPLEIDDDDEDDDDVVMIGSEEATRRWR